MEPRPLSAQAAWLCAIVLLLAAIESSTLGVEQGAAPATGVVATVIVAKDWKEVLYRETLLRFRTDELLQGFAVWVGACALARGQPSLALVLVAFGVICGLLWWCTRSIWLPVALHAA